MPYQIICRNQTWLYQAARLAGVKRGLPKLKPHASQNWPDLRVPHLGQGSPPLTAWSDRCLPAVAGRPAAEVAGVTGAPARRMPHTSQKSSLTESWPLGHTVIATSPHNPPLTRVLS